MFRTGAMLTVLLCVVFCSVTQAQNQPAFGVSDIQLPNLRWGAQTAVFDITNNTEVTKYVGVVTDVVFSESYLAPKRTQKTFYFVGPQETKTVNPTVYIPGNYGRASIKIALYDVVDTADVILPGSKFLEQPFSVLYSIPAQIAAYFSEKITLPPMVDSHPDFDNEFARVLLYLINEGKTPEQIADLVMADVSFVNSVLEDMVKKGYVKNGETGYRTVFPVIDVKEAEKAKPVAERASDALAAAITRNLPAYWKVLDSLVAAGKVSNDSNFFLDQGTILYRPYPVVACLVLWWDLGTRFITPNSPLSIYEQTDVCNAHIPDYMYAVRGGDVFNGTCYYYQFRGQNVYRLYYGDKPPKLQCQEGYQELAKVGGKPEWRYPVDGLPEDFVFDTLVVKPALDVLVKGVDSTMLATYRGLGNVAKEFGHTEEWLGYRYWFWNLVATRTLDKLAASGTLPRRGNGQFRIVEVPK
jgi:hypothetical protein